MARSDATRWGNRGAGRGAGGHLVAMLRRWEQVAEALGGYAAVAARSPAPGEVLAAIDPLGDRDRQRATLDLVVDGGRDARPAPLSRAHATGARVRRVGAADAGPPTSAGR